MRYVIAFVTACLVAGPAIADKASAPGQQAKGEAAEDLNEDGRINGKDYAPGQVKKRGEG